jgi:hypothetical protein
MTVKTNLILFGGFVLWGVATTMADSNPYQAIVTRNVFGLKEPPPPPQIVEPAKPAPKLTLTGIITIGKTRALMTALPAQPKPGEQPKGPQSFVLAEGERDGEVEVVSIDPALGKVTLKLGDESVTIGFPEYSRSQGGSMGNSPASLPSLSSTLPPQRFPLAQPTQVAQVANLTPAGEAQPEVQTAAAFPQSVAPALPVSGSANPYVRGRAIQHPAADPSLGNAQIRTPFATRSLRRGSAAMQTLQAPEPTPEAPAEPAAQ